MSLSVWQKTATYIASYSVHTFKQRLASFMYVCGYHVACDISAHCAMCNQDKKSWTRAETRNMPHHHYTIYVCTKEGPIESKEVCSRVGNIRSLCHFMLFIVSRTIFKECINQLYWHRSWMSKLSWIKHEVVQTQISWLALKSGAETGRVCT